MTSGDAVIRFMTPNDVAVVAAIEKSATPFPWTESIFRGCLKVGFVCRVMEMHKAVIGFAILSHGAGEGHVLNLGLKPEYQRRGFGRRLLRALIDDARRLGLSTVFLEVRASNARAIALYNDEGFNEIGVRQGYYPAQTGREDALVFARELVPQE